MSDQERISELEREVATLRERLAMATEFRFGRFVLFQLPASRRWMLHVPDEPERGRTLHDTIEAAFEAAKEI